MSGRFAGKTAIVTGASKGIGRAIALALGSEGAQVVVNYLSSGAAAEEVVKQIGPDRAIAVKADVSDIAGGKTLVAQTVQRFGKIDILVLNAGSLLQNGSLADLTEDAYDRLFRTNVKGPLFLVKVSFKIHTPSLPTFPFYRVNTYKKTGGRVPYPLRWSYPVLL